MQLMSLRSELCVRLCGSAHRSTASMPWVLACPAPNPVLYSMICSRATCLRCERSGLEVVCRGQERVVKQLARGRQLPAGCSHIRLVSVIARCLPVRLMCAKLLQHAARATLCHWNACVANPTLRAMIKLPPMQGLDTWQMPNSCLRVSKNASRLARDSKYEQLPSWCSRARCTCVSSRSTSQLA